jgi:hypothetical protein
MGGLLYQWMERVWWSWLSFFRPQAIFDIMSKAEEPRKRKMSTIEQCDV